MQFPDPEFASPQGIVAVGGDLTPATLESAYTQGIFPWPQGDLPLLWFSPAERGVLFFKNFKIPESTQRKLRKNIFQVRFNTAFDQVIENCAQVPRNHESGTWITPAMIEAYKVLHKKGQAHSVEAFVDDQLVGGLYGVQFRGVFSGESMFFKESEASKVCLVALVEKLQGEGQEWMDIQMVTPLLEKMGGDYMLRQDFLTLLKATQK